MKPIVEYQDYHAFLSDYYEERKRTSAFSWREFAKIAGFVSPSYLKMVCEGKTNLSRVTIERVAQAIGLVGFELDYFKAMVNFGNAKKDDVKRRYFDEMRSIATEHKVRVVDKTAFEFYDSWKNPVVRELAPMMPGAKPLDIAKACGNAFSAEEIRNALAFLTRAKFLKKTANDTYEQVERSLQMSVAAMPTLVREMHKEMADFAKDAIEKYPVEERNFTGITMGIDDEDYAEILKELEACRKRIISIATAKKGGNRVYRLNMQLFPLTDKVQNIKTSQKK